MFEKKSNLTWTTGLIHEDKTDHVLLSLKEKFPYANISSGNKKVGYIPTADGRPRSYAAYIITLTFDNNADEILFMMSFNSNWYDRLC